MPLEGGGSARGGVCMEGFCIEGAAPPPDLTGSWYASYWNSFLLEHKIYHPSFQCEIFIMKLIILH